MAESSQHVLGVADYVVFALLLVVSASVGLYHAAFRGCQRTSKEYFLADREMHPIPVAISISVSVISAITFIGTPALSYVSGVAFWPSSIFGRIIPAFIIAFIFCPVLYNLKITSIYEYLEIRFNSLVRYLAVFIQITTTFLILGVVVYAPALALNAVTGLSLPGSILAVGLISTFYSSLGGIKAVVWNDVLQSSVMMVGFCLIIITGCVKVGGFNEMWSRATEGNRTVFFDFRIDPTIRLSFWTTTVGGTFLMITYAGANQNQAQRFLTCKDLKSAQIASFLGLCLIGVLEILAVFCGIVIYSYFFRCDPITNGFISKPDQILPFFAIEVFGDIPGLTGLLVSAVCSASLSTISTAINGIVTVIGEGVVKKLRPGLSETKFVVIMKVSALVCGLLFMAMAVVASFAGNMIITLGQGIAGALGGATAGVFLLGILIPFGNAKGATAGIIIGGLLGGWVLIGSVLYPPISTTLPLSNDMCASDDTVTGSTDITHLTTLSDPSPFTSYSETPVPDSPGDSRTGIQRFYSISFLYFSVISLVSSFVIGVITSLLFPCKDPVKADLLSPLAVRIIGKLPQCLGDKCRISYAENEAKEGKREVEITDDTHL